MFDKRKHMYIQPPRCLLVFDLEVEVSAEPVVEGGLVYVAGGVDLHRHPVALLVVVDGHREVTHLTHPHEPVALHESVHANGDHSNRPVRLAQSVERCGSQSEGPGFKSRRRQLDSSIGQTANGPCMPQSPQLCK